MYFSSMQALLDMNGHGFYVWSAYGISYATIIGMLVHANTRHKKLCKEIAQQVRE